MQTEIIPLCLKIMKRGLDLSKTVATFIVEKILLDDNGLNYICQTADRYFAVRERAKKLKGTKRCRMFWKEWWKTCSSKTRRTKDCFATLFVAI